MRTHASLGQKKGEPLRHQCHVAHAESHSLATFVATSDIWMMGGNAMVTPDHSARNTAFRGSGLCSSSWKEAKVSAASLLCERSISPATFFKTSAVASSQSLWRGVHDFSPLVPFPLLRPGRCVFLSPITPSLRYAITGDHG